MRLLLPTLFVVIAFGCLCDRPVEPSLHALEWVEAAPLTVDGPHAAFALGRVVFGQQAIALVKLRNTGNRAVALSVSSSSEDIQARLSADHAEAGGEVGIEVSFAPRGDGELYKEYDSEFAIQAEGVSVLWLRVRGQAVTAACELPEELSFGSVRIGERSTKTLWLENTTASAVTLNWGDVRGAHATAFDLESDAHSARLEGPGRVGLDVTFQPLDEREYLGILDARVSQACPFQAIRLKGTGVSNYLTWSPERVDCGAVPLGRSVRRTISFQNASSSDVNVRDFALSGRDVSPSSTELRVPSAGSASVEIVCSPMAGGDRSDLLRFETNLPTQPDGAIAVNLLGGAPEIDIRPRPLDFGRVAWFDGGSPVSSRRVKIFNVGTPGIGALQLEQPTIIATGGAWSLTPLAGYEDAGLQATPSASAWFDVSITPAAPGVHSSIVRIESNDFNEPFIELPVTATAASLPPCVLGIEPATLDFGIVSRSEGPLEQIIRIRNLSQTPQSECLLSSIETDGVGFSLSSGRIESMVLAPGQALDLTVRFEAALAAIGLATGALSLEVSSPTAPHVLVPLRANVGEGCLVPSPAPARWLAVPLTCAQRRTLSLYNICSFDVVYTGASVTSDAGFRVLGSPDAGSVVHPSEGANVELEFEPDSVGAHAELLRVSYVDNGPTSKLIELDGNGVLGTPITETHGVPSQVQGDFLVCQLMGGPTPTFEADVLGLYLGLIDAGVDLHLGLIAGHWDYIEGEESRPGFVAPPLFGSLLPGVDGGGPVVFSAGTDGGAGFFAHAMSMTTGTSSTHYFGACLESARRALRVYNNTLNAGFRRSGVPLTLFSFDTQGDRSSPTRESFGYRPPAAPLSYYQSELLDGVGGELSLLQFNALTASSIDCSADGGLVNVRDQEMADWSHGVQLDLCQQPLSQLLSNYIANSVQARRRFSLRAVPILSSVEVRVNGAQVSWTWISDAGYLELTTPPPTPSTVSISYVPACLP